MKFHVAANTAFFINGKLKSVVAGEIETTDEGLIKCLENAKGVTKIEVKAKAKSKQVD